MVVEKEDPSRTVTEASVRERIAERALKAAASMPSAAKEELLATRTAYGAPPPEVPVEVELERQVLRFHSYFKEAVHESPVEDFRVRRVDIMLYLVDGKIMVVEHKETNSGMPQGTMLKRHRVAKRADSVTGDVDFYGWEDLFIGNTVTFYGRTYMISDCDPFTRAWYADRGFDQGPPQDTPLDAVTTQRLAPKKTSFKKEMYPTKKFMEARLGKTIEDPEKLRKFLEYDGKVLRFDGVWDDLSSLHGDRNCFILNYFLANDTVEVREVRTHNSGKNPFPSLLARSPLPKDFKVAREAGPPEEHPELYYRAPDFIIGRTINVLGRDVQLRGCDPFTRTYFQDVLGITQPPPIVEPTDDEEERKTKAKVEVPPPTGYGDDEDSLASFYHLRPKVPKKDFNRYMEFDGVIFRFLAKLVDPTPEDAVRRFVIALYEQDGTVGIYEPPIRNSGIVGGKFLNRGKHKTEAGELFSPADFTIGEEITVAKRRFLITGVDGFTRKNVPGLGPNLE